MFKRKAAGSSRVVLDNKSDRPSQKYWNDVRYNYYNPDEVPFQNRPFEYIPDLPENVETFLSSKVPWKYQQIDTKKLRNAAANDSKLRMVRVWTTQYSQETGTVDGAVEVTGLFYNDGTSILWRDLSTPPEEAFLVSGSLFRNNGVPDRKIDDAHLDVVLFNVPRKITFEYYEHGRHIDTLTVQGTVRHVLQALYERVAYLRKRKNVGGYNGLKRSFEDAARNSTTYELYLPELDVDNPSRISAERAKWQQKIKNIVGVEGGMNDLHSGEREERNTTRGRTSVYAASPRLSSFVSRYMHWKKNKR